MRGGMMRLGLALIALLAISTSAIAVTPGVIAYTSTQGGVSSIYLMPPDGSNSQLVVTNGKDPTFSADGNTIYFVRGADLYAVSRTGTDLRPLTHHGVGVFIERPVASADGSMILYNMGPVVPNPLVHIQAYYTNDDPERMLVADAMDPTFSPEQVYVLFARDSDIYTMSRNSMAGPPFMPNIMVAHPLGVQVRYPAYGLNGLVFASRPMVPNAVWNLHAVSLSGNRIERVLAENASQPTVSPDGSRIAFVRNDDLWVMEADGSHPQRMTNTAAIESSPAWWGTAAR